MSRCAIALKSGRTPNAFSTLSFPLSDQATTAINSAATDLNFLIVFNGPSGQGLVVFDNLRVSSPSGPSEGFDPGTENDVSLAFSIPSNSTVEDLVVASKETIEPRDRLAISGSVVSTHGDVRIGNDATVKEVVSGGGITIGDRAVVSGGVLANGTAQISSSATVGSVQQQADVDFRDVTWSVTRPSGPQLAISLGPAEKKHLSPGSYGDLSVKSNARLYLTSGEYFFDQVQIEPQATIVTESSDGPVELYVSQGFTFRGVVSGVNGIATLHRLHGSTSCTI